MTTRDYLRWFWRSLIRRWTADATAAAGRTWRTGYYVAGRDWPVPPAGIPTAAETHAALKDFGEGHEHG